MPTDTAAEQRGEHLKRYAWKPGQSGNPKGRPRGVKEFRVALRDNLDTEEFAKQVIRIATEEQAPWAIALLVERLWPKRLELETAEVQSFEGPYLAPFTSTDEAQASRGECASDAEVVEMVRDNPE